MNIRELRSFRSMGFWQGLCAFFVSLYCLLRFPAETTWVPHRPREGTRRWDDYNTLRHTLWMCLMTAWFGQAPARRVADVHEYENPHPRFREDMCIDLYNNEQGIRLGARIRSSSGWGCVECHRSVRKVWREGRLRGEGRGLSPAPEEEECERLLNQWKNRTSESRLPWNQGTDGQSPSREDE